jgi:hypothetical protein
MSCSSAQLDANRANSQLSTGPKSEEGKARSSLNALKHGFFSQSVVIEGEDPAQFRALHEEYNRTFCPCNIMERELVERMAGCLWKRNRIQKLEQQFWASDHTFSTYPGEAFLRLSSYEQRLNNDYHRCLRELRTVRGKMSHFGDAFDPPSTIQWMEIKQPEPPKAPEPAQPWNEAKFPLRNVTRAPKVRNEADLDVPASPIPAITPLSGIVDDVVQSFLSQRKALKTKSK